MTKMGVVTMGDLKTNISGKRAFRPSSSTRQHATEWYSSPSLSFFKLRNSSVIYVRSTETYDP